MEETCKELAKYIYNLATQCPRQTYLVSIAGAPGSGKTTIANKLVDLLKEENALYTLQQDPAPFAVSISIDGFHYPRSTLDGFPNRTVAYMRRGAPWTFDIGGILTFINHLRQWADQGNKDRPPGAVGETLRAPSFDHAIKDPVPDAITIYPGTSIIILEGNYLLLDEDGWRNIRDLIDLSIFIDVDVGEMRKRVAKRHVTAGIESNLDDGYNRVDRNDLLNAQLIKEKLLVPNIRIKSIQDIKFSSTVS
ncbi:phosphoribulokinase/uridine kinase [Xylogone sp. PMI_703]|nr:phosphoribulokinase/uridine kinase [Xylogone sp. PMI_703]